MELLRRKPKETAAERIGRIALGGMLIFAGITHLTFARKAFRRQVPRWLVKLLPISIDDVVVWSGVVEVSLGASLALLAPWRVYVGLVAGTFFVAIFPGNIAQYTEQRSAFGLDTDGKRLARLFGQPLLVAWALWSTGAWRSLRKRLR